MSQSNKQKSKALETSLEREESSSSLSLEYTSDTNISNEIDTNPNISDEIDPNHNISNEINSGGRNLHPVWQYFHQEKAKSREHFSAKCVYCIAKWARGEPVKLKAHLAFVCPNIEYQIQQLFLYCIAARDNFDEFEEIQSEGSINLKKQRLNNNKPGLKKYFLQTAEILSEEWINSINCSLLKVFVVCGVSFSLIEYPFFIDALKNLCPSYQPPSREVFAGRLLDQECSRVIIKREAIFNKSKNLTINGWMSLNGSSIYNFIILTPNHNKFLYSLNDFSENSHTAEFLANKIDAIFRTHICITSHKECNEIIRFFKKSHQPSSYLHQAICELNIASSGLKKFVDTRWTSAYESTLLVSQLERAFIKIMNDNPDLITNRTIKQVLR
ncbi:12411_t:CDS:2 [Gigaspora margarita]|uniref:12411_t:CDS:1 n=1 Tax=Gigaspora margarita TaxID=4874 RepID=A0ABN7UWT3_GIGMA|nr:12411_t:CDS:2 [Gigaspora margarita]